MSASIDSIIDDDTRALTIALEVLNAGNVEVVAAAIVAIARCATRNSAERIALDTMADLCDLFMRAAEARAKLEDEKCLT